MIEPPAPHRAPVLVIGAGGHGRVVLDALLASSVAVMGILERDERLWGTKVMGVPVLGGDDWADELAPDAARLAIGVAGFGMRPLRPSLIARWRERGHDFAGVVHPSAVVSAHAVVADGAQVLARAVINPGAWVATHVIVNSGAIVEHDCVVQEGAHLAPAATLGGGVTIGAWAQLGMHATVLPGRTVGAGAIVAAGAVVTHDVAPGELVAGVPARHREGGGHSAHHERGL